MFFFVVFGIILLASALLALGAVASGNGIGGVLALVGGAVLAALTWGVFSFTHVDHREVAIVTTFGRYDGAITTGGAHWLKPWSSVEKFDRTVQTAEVTEVSVSFSDGGDEDGLQEIGGGKGSIDGAVRWQMSGEGEGPRLLWERYRTFEAVQDSLVTRSARDTIINVANSYPAATAIISQAEISAEVKRQLDESMKPYGIVVDSVSIPAISLDSGTQGAVDRLFTTQQDIKRAQNEQVRAEIDAETVRIRTEEGALSPEANQRFCLDLVNSWDVGKNGSLPATFNCNFAAGEQPQVIVNTP